MRSLVRGSIVLGFAAALLPWSASEHSTHVRAGPQVASSEIDAKRTRSSAASVRAIGGRTLDGHGHGIITSGATPVDSGKQAARLNYGAMGSIPVPAKRLQDEAAMQVRKLVPGSKAQSPAVSSSIGSDEFKDAAGPLARLYFAYFDRFPDYEGLDYYIDQRRRGRALDSIADEFAGSREFSMRYGTVDDGAFVDRVYLNVFGAPPDPAHRAYWVDQLDSGMTRGEVMLAFSEGTGFRAITGNEVFVAMAYAETLQRAPDHADFVRWVSFLDAGNPRDAVIDGLLATRRVTRR